MRAFSANFRANKTDLRWRQQLFSFIVALLLATFALGAAAAFSAQIGDGSSARLLVIYSRVLSARLVFEQMLNNCVAEKLAQAGIRFE